jgi:hypothetical protein
LISYRFRRRAFLTAMSGGVGLKIMLRNLEGSAAGARSPGRLLVTHWPVGIVAGKNDELWKPTTGSVGGSPGLEPFADAGLGPDMTVIRGLSTSHLTLNGGGGSEGGTVTLVTGRSTGGTRANCCESDDAFAAPGGSFDQILLENVAALQRPGEGYASSIADSRTDWGEISTQCLSYATRVKDVDTYLHQTSSEAAPLMPVLSPLAQYDKLFSGMMPGATGTGGSGGGGTSPRVADAMLKRLVGRRSVLDFAAEELNQLKAMGPSDSRHKLSIHTEAVIAAETSIANAINTGYPNRGGGGAGGGGGSLTPTCGGTCATRPPAPPPLTGMADPTGGRPGSGNSYGNPTALQDDAPVHAAVGKAHLDVLKAAFVCDLIRVGTYQWSPGTNHVGFALYPGTTQPFQHHPTSHRINTVETTASATVAGLDANAAFLFNVQLWYFARHAENLATWKTALDGCGNSLLDFTCVPFLTEIKATSHERSNMAAMLIGGKQLGFVHDRYVSAPISINELWGTIAQAFGHTSTDAPFAPPVAGFWAKPAQG